MGPGPIRKQIGRVVDRLQSGDGSHSEVRVDGMRAGDVEAAAAVLGEAFRPERFTTAAFGGNSDAIQRGFSALMAAKLRTYRRANQPLFVARDDGVVGVVILSRPAFEPSTLATARALLGQPRPLARLAWTADPSDIYRVLQAHETPDSVAATNYRLEYIGVHPDRQGEEIGGRLLDAVHGFTDRDPGAEGVSLVTAGENTRDIYAGYGYETVEIRVDERFDLDGRPLRAYHMHRPARRSAVRDCLEPNR